MKILLTGTEDCGLDRVERVLRSADHEVFTCDAAGSSGRCRASSDQTACPAIEGIDVIVAARERPLPHLTARERLTGCALLRTVPLVVIGSTVLNPYGSRAGHVVEGFDSVLDAVELGARPEASEITGPLIGHPLPDASRPPS